MNEDRPVGSRFVDPTHGELIVVEETNSESCGGCAYRKFNRNTMRSPCTAPRLTGRCGTTRVQGDSVVFAKPENYAAFKLTGEWPCNPADP